MALPTIACRDKFERGNVTDEGSAVARLLVAQGATLERRPSAVVVLRLPPGAQGPVVVSAGAVSARGARSTVVRAAVR
jgi:hypothetical protein